MNTYRIIQRIDTWATIEISAENEQEALTRANYDGDLEWSYDTDYDSAETVTWDLISSGTTEDLMGVEFVDPYLGRDDVVYCVNAHVEGDAWQAEIVTSDNDDDLGETDVYDANHIQMHRIER